MKTKFKVNSADQRLINELVDHMVELKDATGRGASPEDIQQIQAKVDQGHQAIVRAAKDMVESVCGKFEAEIRDGESLEAQRDRIDTELELELAYVKENFDEQMAEIDKKMAVLESSLLGDDDLN